MKEKVIKDQKKIKNFKIKTKLLLGFIFVIAFFSIISIISYIFSQISINKFDKMIETMFIINDVTNNSLKIKTAMIDYYNEKNEDYVEIIHNSFAKIDNNLKKLNNLITEKFEIIILEEISNNIQKMKDNGNEAINLIKENNITDSFVNVENLKSAREIVETRTQQMIGIELTNNNIIKQKLTQNSRILGVFTFFVIIIFSLLFIICAFIYSNGIIKPLKSVSDMIKIIASGEGDLTQNLKVQSDDEIGVLSKHFNDFIKSLAIMIKHIKSVAKKTREIGTNLASSSEESTTSLEEIRIHVQNMKNKTVFLDSEISKATNLSNEVKTFISDSEYLVDTQTEAIDESSASIAEMLVSIKNLAHTTEEKYENALILQNIAITGEKMMNDYTEIIKKISDSTNVIMELLKVINNTASQTRLLAMNAAIESSHAGEYGKGFAVVADEIRKLSENTSTSSKEISNSLKELLSYMNLSKESTAKTTNIFKEMVSSISGVSTSMVEMKDAMKELSLESEQIKQALASLVKITEDVKTSYSNIDKNVLSITDSLNNVSSISLDTKNGMEEVTIGINDLCASVMVISQSGNSNKENISVLETLIDKFKIEED